MNRFDRHREVCSRYITDVFFPSRVSGADINAQTEETQETALTLACCGGFLDVAEFLYKAGADLELGCRYER